MILGLIAGRLAARGRGGPPAGKLGRLVLAGVVGVGARPGARPPRASARSSSGSGRRRGSCSAAGSASRVLGLLYALIDLTGYAGWTYPLRVIGRNSIAAYCLAHLIDDFIRGSFRTHLGTDVFHRWGEAYEPLARGRGRARGLLADPVLDGPAADLSEGLTPVSRGKSTTSALG